MTLILRQYVIGAAISGGNIGIHAMVTLIVIAVTRRAAAGTAKARSFRLIAVMISAALVLMVGHLAEVLVWSLAYAVVGAAPDGADLVYFAFVNYTTLGYGDVIPVERWRLLGPITAMNGVLLFGWSTAVIFEVLQKALILTEHRNDPSSKAGPYR